MARILLVEDENILNMVTQDRVESMGHTVCGMAGTGLEAIREAEEKKPDVIIMDIMLRGDMDGIEAAGRIRETQSTPIIYLTAYDDEITRQRAAATSPAAYLVKIFEDVDLQSAIDLALQSVPARRPAPGTLTADRQGSPIQFRGENTERAAGGPETQR